MGCLDWQNSRMVNSGLPSGSRAMGVKASILNIKASVFFPASASSFRNAGASNIPTNQETGEPFSEETNQSKRRELKIWT